MSRLSAFNFSGRLSVTRPTLSWLFVQYEFFSHWVSLLFPGRSGSMERSGMMRCNPDGYNLEISDDPGSAAHRFTLRRIRETPL